VISWRDLRPILAGTFEDVTAAFACLASHAELIERMTSAVWKRWGGSRTFPAASREDLFQEVLVRLVSRIRDKNGLARPEDWAERSAAPWFGVVVQNQATDVLRAWKPEPRERIAEVSAELVAHESATPDLEAKAMELESKRIALIRTEIDPKHALAYVLTDDVRAYEKQMVGRACAISRGEEGLSRSEEETTRHIDAWMRDHGGDPRKRPARRAVFWILRSTSTLPPEEWRKSSPGEFVRARDTVYQWTCRARQALRGYGAER
jgi:DNA-directed RNA polymerase specialized sigma24 family protein